ncbi:MAG: type I secretion system permease/ATPase [Rubrivivax sp.]|nr:type I secretion system permease/ATPase [Rubrivivax sp.]
MGWLLSPALRPLTMLAALVSLVLNLTMLVPPMYMLLVFDRVFSSRSIETLVMLTLLAVVGLLLMFLMDAARSAVLAAAGRLLDGRLGGIAMRVTIEDAARFGGATHAGLGRDVGLLRNFVTGNGIFAVFDAPWMPIYLFVIFLFHPLLGVLASAAALALFGLVVLNERLSRAPAEEAMAGSRRAQRFVDAAARNADAVAGMGMTAAVVARWRELHAPVVQAQARLAGVGGPLGAFVRSFRFAMQVAMLALGAWLVIEQHVTPGVMIASTILLARALQPVELLITGWKALVDARGAGRRLAAAPIEAGEQAVALPAPSGRLDVEKVVFGAQPQRPPILKGISFSLQAGETLGLIGPSASGKTTLARLILGIWRPQSGAVRLDGADVSQWSRDELGRHVGYLPQDVELFAGTVAENIARLGPVDSEAVVRAAQLAGAHEMILRLPAGYETPIGDAGSALSGGQRQRIGLARALYGEPQLVVLDEPNANLDSEGEAALGATLAALKAAGRTVVLIGHKPSMMAGVDKLAVLVEGALDGFDRPQALMARYTTPRTGAAPVRAAAD